MDIKIKNICKSFGEQVVLKDYSLEIPAGSRVCIMAPSGSGKTTLINILLGLTKADSGQIEGLQGLKISAVFQEDRLIEGSDVYANLNAVRRQKMQPAELDAALAAIGMTDYKGKPVRELSGGMKRRVAILRALLSDYDFLVLDEPFKGLDEKLKEQVINYVKEKTEGRTVLLITHEAEDAEKLGARVFGLGSAE